MLDVVHQHKSIRYVRPNISGQTYLSLGQIKQKKKSLPDLIERDLHSSKCKLWFSQALTVIVSTDCANQAEELNHPAEAILHLKNKHTGQDLGEKHR